MLRILFALFALARFSVAEHSEGCDNRDVPRHEGGKLITEFEVEGRDVYISFPKKFRSRKPTSLIVAYHDTDMSPKELEKLTKFDVPDLNRNSIVVYPTNYEGRWMTDPESQFKPKEDSWDSFGEDKTNDLFYTRALLAHLGKTYCLNLRRIYAVGLGSGGGVVQQLACQPQQSRRFAAFAMVAPGVYQGGAEDRFWGQCVIGRRPVPVLAVHGEKDEVYPVNGGKKQEAFAALPASTWATRWAETNACLKQVKGPVVSLQERTAVITQFESGQRAESAVFAGGVTKTSYRCGEYWERDNGNFTAEEKDLGVITVLSYVVKDAPHGWIRQTFEPVKEEVTVNKLKIKPTGFPAFDSSNVIINFFNAHRLPPSDVVHNQGRELLIERGATRYNYNKEQPQPDFPPEKEL